MSIATTDFYDSTKYQVKSFVSATHTEGLSLFRGVVAELGGLFGGKSDMMNKKVNDVMNQLIEKLRKQIRGNEKLIGVRFQFAEFGRSEGNTFLSGIATGTIIAPISTTGGSRKQKTRRLKQNKTT